MIKTPNFVLFVSFVVNKILGLMRDRSQARQKFKTLRN